MRALLAYALLRLASRVYPPLIGVIVRITASELGLEP